MASDRDELIKQYLRNHVALFGPVAFVPPSETGTIDQPAPIQAPVALEKPVKSKPPATVVADAALFPKKLPATPAIAPKQSNQAWLKATDLKSLNEQICGCMNCPLGSTRTKFVFGVGSPNAKLVVIGEAPGKDEDEQGEPFVGRAGKLLNDILKAINFTREEVFICNILKCRPPGNRDPLPAEVAECEPYLHKQLALLQPKLILALGRISANTLLKTNLTLRDLRATTHDYQGIPMLATYHPAALLRNPAWKKDTWEDVQKLRKMYDELVG